jgi:predicted nucleic acid-binding protein
MTGRCFADTFYWIALATPQDAWHARVVAWERANAGAQLVATEEVLAELLTWFAGSGPGGRNLASAVVRRIQANPQVQVLPQTSADFQSALALYEARPDKGYSLTDCRSMLAMRALSLTEVLTNDHHFTQEGFTILFP